MECPVCDGIGWYWDSMFGIQEVPCTLCWGTGKINNKKDKEEK